MKLIASTLAVAAVALAGMAVLPAGAKETAPQKATTSCSTCVAPITCSVEVQCVLDFVGNGGLGYWRARQWNGSTWVRLTMVNGQ